MPTKSQLLVVDDDPDVLVALKAKLERTGRYDVRTATGGNDALRSLRDRRPDLILCDIDMPGMDGGAFAATLREDRATSSLPLVFLSALVSPADSAREGGGGWPMLSKRSSIDDLVKKIDELIANAK